MPRRFRLSGLMFALAPLLATSCNGLTNDKLAGQWEATEGPIVDTFKGTLAKADDPRAKVSAVVEFNTAGDYAMVYRVQNLGLPGMRGKYRIEAGDVVELYDLSGPLLKADTPKSMKVKLTVSVDTLAFTDAAGTTTFKRTQLPPHSPATTPTKR